MNAPAAVSLIMSRVASMTKPPAALADLRDRFGAQLADSASITNNTSIATATGSMPSTPTTQPARITRFSTRSATYDPTTYSSLAGTSGTTTPEGVWVDRVPNERGKALAPAIQAAADRYNLDPAFLAAVFWTESSYHPDAVSRTGAIGLGQLMPETAEWLHVDPRDPMQNIDGSARLYRYLIDRNDGNMPLAIASYAAGQGAVKRAGGVPDQFTANYITKLLGRRDYLNGDRSTAP